MAFAQRDARGRGRRLEGGFLGRIGAGRAAIVREPPAFLVGDDPVDCRTHALAPFRRGVPGARP